MLSDATIKSMISNNQLIDNGVPALALQSSYHFRCGKIFTGGEDCKCLDWDNPKSDDSYTLKSRSMIWVRMKEDVNLPPDICALWWQTHHLSLKGVALINMSIVDPGYQGPLACLFVNFGTQNVVLTPSTVMAKLAFFKMDQTVDTPYTAQKSRAEYDRDLFAVAANGPTTFLRIADMIPEIEIKKNEFIENLRTTKDELVREFASDFPKYLRRTFAWSAVGFAVLLAAITFIPWLQSAIQPNLSMSIKKAVDDRISEHLSLSPQPDQVETAHQISALRDQVKALADEVSRAKTSRLQMRYPKPGKGA